MNILHVEQAKLFSGGYQLYAYDAVVDAVQDICGMAYITKIFDCANMECNNCRGMIDEMDMCPNCGHSIPAGTLGLVRCIECHSALWMCSHHLGHCMCIGIAVPMAKPYAEDAI